MIQLRKGYSKKRFRPMRLVTTPNNTLAAKCTYVELMQLQLEMNASMIYNMKLLDSNKVDPNQAEMNLRKDIAKSRYPQEKALQNLEKYAAKKGK